MSYKKKPVLIQIISLLYLLSPLGNLLMTIFVSTKLTPLESVKRLFELAFIYRNPVVMVTLLLWATAIPLAIGLYQVKGWSWYLFMVHSVATFVVGFIKFKYEIQLDSSLAASYFFRFGIESSTIVNTLFLIPAGIFLHSEIRTPYFNPHLQWWQQKTRYKHEENVQINGSQYKTYDISETGAFIVCPEIPHFKEGQELRVMINLDNFHLKCHAEAIWENDGTNHYPMGYGIKFLDLRRLDRSKIRYFINNLKLQGKEER